mgnify:FL=1
MNDVVFKVEDYREIARSRVTEQFVGKVVFNRYLDLLLKGQVDLQLIYKSLKEDRWIDTATGYTLDIIGKIVGQDRVITDSSLKEYFAFLGVPLSKGYGDSGIPNSGGIYYSLTDSGEDEYIYLSDEEYRVMILGKIYKNTTSATNNEFINFFYFVFGDKMDYVSIVSEGGAAASVIVRGIFSEFETALITYTNSNMGGNSYFVPKPIGVNLDIEVINNFDVIESLKGTVRWDVYQELGIGGKQQAGSNIGIGNPLVEFKDVYSRGRE